MINGAAQIEKYTKIFNRHRVKSIERSDKKWDLLILSDIDRLCWIPIYQLDPMLEDWLILQ